jgi:predicted RNA-binding protein with RPS1 domain
LTSTLDSPAVTSSTPQVAINDIGSMEDFLAAIDETIKYFNDGDIVEGTIVKVDRDEVLLDIGYKTEGVIPSRELSIKHDVDPNEVVKVGDVVEALVLQKEDKEGRLILSKKRAQYERAWGTIEKIKEEDGIVTGTVIEVVKGGLILDIGLRGFLPASLVEMRRVRDLQPYVGKELEAKIIELDKNRNNVVLSRRQWLEQTQSEVRSTFLATLQKSQVRSGVVSSIVNFGPSWTSAASTAWCTSPSCPGSTSTTRPRWSRWARRSPSRCSTSTWTASASPCRSRRRRRTPGSSSPAPTPSRRSCRARSPSSSRSVRSCASTRASRAWCTSPSWPSATSRSPSRS